MSVTTIIKELNSFQVDEIIELTNDKNFVIFDMDGTILQSEGIHHLATNKLLSGIHFSEEELYGLADIDLFKLASKYYEGDFESFVTKKNKMIIDSLDDQNINELMFSDYPKLFKSLIDNHKSLALVTASEHDVAHALLKHCNIHHFFDLIITTKEVTLTKPNPEPYLLALSKTGRESSEAIIFEDSETGLQAALSSGIDTVKVTWYEN